MSKSIPSSIFNGGIIDVQFDDAIQLICVDVVRYCLYLRIREIGLYKSYFDSFQFFTILSNVVCQFVQSSLTIFGCFH